MTFDPKKLNLNGIYQSILDFLMKMDFHFKALEHGFSLCRVRTGLLYFQNMVVIFSEYILSP